MFDTIFEAAAQVLDFFYAIVPNYAIAIMLMTLLVMLVTTPLTLKGTRGMIKMQLLQPELKKIQEKHKGGDRQEMNAELMAFYQENELNPLGGCLPLLVQAPVFLLLFRLIRGLTRTTVEACPESVTDAAQKCFDPQYLDHTSSLYQDLVGRTEMKSFGLDLAQSTSDALGESIIHGMPYLILILLMIGAQYLQQKQVSARNPDGGMAMPQQKILLRVMPAFFGVISINFPAALVVYWVTSSVYRIGLQAYITRSLYGHDDAPGAKANKAAAEARKLAKDGKDTKNPKDAKGGAATGNGTPASSSGNGGASGNGSAGGKYQPSSKKKKKKRR
ncbi:YidC/Oxa1 family membrane protein insertase [Actinospongicola halichondriae]|uniref:YidC/Oxa1 family membrane protein insertase n=1 Tax=Actinospongicola halichondriae TaxID=3236844 RepID=UPI003D56B62A